MMSNRASRRNFLAAGLAIPAAGAATTTSNEQLRHALRLAADDGPTLKYRKIGNTGLKVTEVSFGCMLTSDPTVIEAALDLGINLFDTARVYGGGNNERMVGTALGSKRKDIVLCSKAKGNTKAEVMEHLETSLNELGTDYLDIWYLHSRSEREHLNDDVLSALDTAKQQGKVRFGGFSTHSNQKDLLRFGATLPQVDVILTGYNFTMDAETTEAVAVARKAGKGIVGMKVMAGGFRSVKPDNPLYNKFKQDGALLAALKWVLNDKNVDTTIPSITDMAQLEENLQAMSSGLSNEEKDLLAQQREYIRPLYCTICGSCSGQCPKGLPVSDMIRYVSYAEGYGQFQMGRENYLRLPREHQDVRCSDCDTCAIQCPNGVNVAARVGRAQELFA
jgi:uncharacterized protein